MGLRVSGKHMDIGDAFRDRIEGRIDEALAKYFDRGADGHVTVEKAGTRFTTDCMLHLDSGVVLQATGEAQDPQASFDAAAERIEKRLRRYKRRLKQHHTEEAASRAEEYAYRVLEALPETEEEAVPEDYAPVVVAERSLQLKTMPVSSPMANSPVSGSA